MSTWKTYNVYVDIETGEQLDEHVALLDYKIITKTNKSTYNATTEKGTKTIYNECKRSNQLDLFRNTNNKT